MSTYTLAPYAFAQFTDGNGDPLAGGLIYTYAAGTATPATTYSNSTGTPNANPIVLDSEGRCVIYLAPTSYKFIVKTSAGVTIPGGTQDNIAATPVGSSSGLGDVFVFGGQSNSPITGTSYPSGATYDKLHPGTAVFPKDANDLVGTYVLQVTGEQLTSGTLTVALVNLSDGAPDTPLATATITSTTGALATSGAITFPAGGASKQYGIKVKVSANTGFAWGARLVKTA